MALWVRQYPLAVAVIFTLLCSTLLASSSDSHDIGLPSVRRAKGRKVELQRYHTEPNFRAVLFDIIRRPTDPSLLAPGLLFMTIASESGEASPGAQIYDMDGNLVWHSGAHLAQGFEICDFLGHEGDHLALHGDHHQSHVLDQKYQIVSKNVSGPNGHEYNVLPGGRSILRIVAVKTPLDLSPYIDIKNGWVKDNCFEEIDIESGKRIFQWCYLDWLPVWDTTIFIEEDSNRAFAVNATMRASKAGQGTEKHAWDFIHGNSIDKFDGDYIISCRHLDQVLKIAGPDNPHGVKPGTVLWRLGGLRSDFEQDFTFTRQHHARYISVTANETIISLFNNAWEGELPPSAKASEGQIIKINNVTMTAELVARYPHPDNALSEGRGSTQILPNGNALVGYGRFPDITEHLENGTVLYHARYSSYMADRDPYIDILEMDWSYRVFKYSTWVGQPTDPPKVLVYSLDCQTTIDSPLVAYVSWNGATEVVSWRFFLSTIGQRKRSSLWENVGTVPKEGFETQVYLSSPLEARLLKFTPHIQVQALDADGEVLSTVYANTWVPKRSVRKYCDEDGCLGNSNKPFEYSINDAQTCQAGDQVLPPIFALALFVVFLEAMVYFGQTSLAPNFSDLKALWFAAAGGQGQGQGQGQGNDGENVSDTLDRAPLISGKQPAGD